MLDLIFPRAAGLSPDCLLHHDLFRLDLLRLGSAALGCTRCFALLPRALFSIAGTSITNSTIVARILGAILRLCIATDGFDEAIVTLLAVEVSAKVRCSPGEKLRTHAAAPLMMPSSSAT